jgi:putative ABC transport system permease protein
MLFWTIVKVGLKSLLASKLRSFLAMLGIIIGVAAVISMLALGAGAKAQVLARISAMGTNLLMVRPGQSGFHGVMSGVQQNLTLADAQAILDEVPGVRQVAPVVNGNAQVKYFNRNTRTNVVGTSTTYLPIRNFEIERGRNFSENEINGMGRVAVIGPVTAQNLFDTGDPINQTVKLNGINFKVLAVMKSKGDQGWFNPDDQVIVPYTTAMKQLFGLDHLREIDVQAADGANLDDLQAKLAALLRKCHRLQDGAPDDFNVRNQAEFVQAATEVTQTFTILLGGIASISLLVGGIGIMNIMLVTVTERTREIGIRKAIGAKERNILLQFLIESVIISGLGGLIGVGAGVGGAALIGRFSAFTTTVELSSILLALSFAVAVGIFFGLYPARRAAKLDPVEALRYE